MNGRVLVVDDDETVLELIRDILDTSGFEMSAVRDPDDVLDAVCRERPDVILIDVMLPRRSGVEVADRIWLNGHAHIPLVAMSASVVMRDLARHTSLFQAVINKPFDLHQFLSVIEEMVALRRTGCVSPALPEHTTASWA